MTVAIAFAQLWGVLQLIVLGSLARTVRAQTVLTAGAVGLYACAPIAVLLQLVWTRPVAWLIGVPLYEVVRTASYTVDPFIEEIVKVLPLAGLLMIPVVKRQWSLTDCVLAGAAAGSGFGLAEALFRYSASANQAVKFRGGWIVATSIVPNLWATFTSWLPAGASFGLGLSAVDHLNLHLVWSALGGLAVGLILLHRGAAGRRAGAALLLFVGADHAAYNASIYHSGPWLGNVFAKPFNMAGPLLWFLPIAALSVAWLLDRHRQRVSESLEPILAAEQPASSRLLGTLRAAISRLPWSLLWVFGFVRLRRAYSSVLNAGLEPEGLHAVLVYVRDRLDRVLAQGEPIPLIPPAWTRAAFLTALRQPAVIVWLVLMTPTVLWFALGGLPQTAWIQRAMTNRVGWVIILVISVAGQVWLAWQVVAGLRLWPQAARFPLGDAAATWGLRIFSGAGAVGFGGYALMRAFTGLSPTSRILYNVHALDAFGSASAAEAVLVPGTAAGMFPPQGAPPDSSSTPEQPGVNMSPGDTPASWPGEANPPNPYDPYVVSEPWVTGLAAGLAKGAVEAAMEGAKIAITKTAVDAAGEHLIHWISEHIPPLTADDPEPWDGGVGTDASFHDATDRPK